MSLWNYYIQAVSIVLENSDGAGTIFSIKRLHDINYYKVVEFIPGQKLKIELQPPGPLQYYGFDLEDRNGQTFISYNWAVDLRKYKGLRYLSNGFLKKWILSFAKKHIMKQIKPATEQNFNKLKMLLETGEVVLQDGRKITLPYEYRQ